MVNVKKFDFRDVSKGLQKLRDFLIGRKHVGHPRYMPLISPRSIPPPDVPRGPYYKYSDQWYGNRNVLGSVKPPVVAPVAEGRKPRADCKLNPNPINFSSLPTPGSVWWFDAHCYYKEVCNLTPCGPSPPPGGPCSPALPAKSPEPKEEKPDCDRGPRTTDKEPSSDVCDPCKPKKC